ncbi:MAG: phage terminase large subunit [Armatimonadota bacterium]
MLKQSAQRLDPEQAKIKYVAPPFRQFVRDAWHVVDPGLEVLWNWHVDAIADHLEAVKRGEIQKLVINIPPGHAKSILVAVMWPAWMWLEKPEWRALFSSYAADLSIRDSVRCRDIIDSQWYQETFTPTWRLKTDQNVKSYFANSQQGFRLSHSVTGKVTGYRGDAIVCDDPLNALDRHSVKAREKVIDWWDRSMSSRLNDKRTGVRVVIMQRLHEEDLTGHILAKGFGYEHLCLPSKYEPERKSRTFIMSLQEDGSRRRELFFEDPREEHGDLLFPQLFTPGVIAEAEQELGDEGFNAQHQHSPMPSEGGMFKERYWRYWCYDEAQSKQLGTVKVALADGDILQVAATPRPKNFASLVQSWDATFKQGGSSYVVGQVWGIIGADRYLLDQVRDKWGFDETVNQIRAMRKRWPLARTIYLEDKANGPAIQDHLKKEISGIIMVEPRGTKEERAWAVVPQIRSQNVYLPHPGLKSMVPGQTYEWVKGFKAEFSVFPNGTNDDQVDTATQALDQTDNGNVPGASLHAANSSPIAQYTPR